MFQDIPKPNESINGLKKYDLGSVSTSSGTSVTVNVTSSIPNYSSLTVDNFYYDVTSVPIGSTSGGITMSISKSYNASTGVLTISRSSGGYTVGKLYAFV